jgi:uncharacterized protein YjbI with pentapeptide repeats
MSPENVRSENLSPDDPESLPITDLLKLTPEELTRRKTAFEVAKLASEAEEKKKQGPLQKIAPHLTPIAAFTGIILSIGTILSLVWNSYETRTEAERKYFNDLVQSASKSDNGTGQRIAGILLLKHYWGKVNYEVVLANALAGMLAHEDDEGILDACAEAIGNAYKEGTPFWDRERIRTILYGNLKGEVGALVRNEKIAIAKNGEAKSALYDMRIRYFCEAVRKNWVDLESVNLGDMQLPKIHLYRAHLKNAILERTNLAGGETQLFGSDFENADLQHADMSNADARGANFNNAQLQSATLTHANLSPLQDEDKVWHFTSFKETHLEGAFLYRIDARGASFERAHMHAASLASARLVPFEDDVGRWHFTSLLNADLSGAFLSKYYSDQTSADARGANFERANLRGANLEGAQFGPFEDDNGKRHCTSFAGATLNDATTGGKTSFESANLEGAQLQSLALRWVNFKNANLGRANLKSANLESANLSGANLSNCQLQDADLEGAILSNSNLERDVVSKGQSLAVKHCNT